MKSYLAIGVGLIASAILLFYFVYSSSQRKSIEIVKGPSSEWMRWMKTYLSLPLDHGYGSHAIVLLAAVYASQSGPILELGMGHWSSPLLHRLALEQGRFLRSADSDHRWINQFAYLNMSHEKHELRYVEVKSEMGIEWTIFGNEDERHWTLVFIDHRPGQRRVFDLMTYAGRSDIVVLHDTEQTSLYKYHKAFYLYPYRYRFKALPTFTDVLSSKNRTLIETIRYLLESTSTSIFLNRMIVQED